MKFINFCRLRFLINFVFITLAIVLPLMICKEYGADLEEGFSIWLIVDGVLLIVQTIVNQFLKTVPVIPEFPPMPPQKQKEHKDE